MIKISSKEIKDFSDYVYKISGIHLDETKGYLLEARLNPLLTSYNLNDYEQLLKNAKKDSTKDLQEKIIDAVTTNETFFFRDKTPFTILQYKLIPELIDRRQKLYKSKQIPLRILSAACSTGQEVYSIGITLLEEIPNINNFDISILGVDIGDEVIAKASYGKYGKFEVERGMKPGLLRKYFNPVDNGWRINDRVRVMANFKKVNLLESFTNIGHFDIIFCRNVAIYFKYNDKVKLFKKLARILEPDGALLVGGSESLSGTAPDFKVNHYLKGIYYTLNDDSKEKSKEVKKFEVHAFNSGKSPVAIKKVKKIKRTIKYINSDEKIVSKINTNLTQKINNTQNTLNDLRQKRLQITPPLKELNKKINNETLPIKSNEIQKEEIIQTKIIIPQEKPRTFHAVINSKRASNSSLIRSIGSKQNTQKPINFASQNKNNGKSLLARIGTK